MFPLTMTSEYEVDSRRRFLTRAAGLVAVTAAGSLVGAATASADGAAIAADGRQHNWRFCDLCYVLFFDGYASKGKCPGNFNGPHRAQGFNFNLYYAGAPLPVQWDWRFCQKCFAMHFGPKAAWGDCSGGGGHVAQGFNFCMRHSQSAPPGLQTMWAYCQNCHCMFFDGYPHNGACAARPGQQHVQQGWIFQLPYL